ncbi:MAG: hypothetical protein ACI4T5_10480 [Prevotella sp.]
MAWIDPKQDWLTTDYFQLDDWNRIVANAQHLYDLLGATFSWQDCYLEDTAALPYYDIVNNLETNLLNLCQASGFSFIEFEATTWQARTSEAWTHNPTATDFIRWESLEYQLYLWYNVTAKPQNTIRAGTFYAGTNRTIQMLSRGR